MRPRAEPGRTEQEAPEVERLSESTCVSLELRLPSLDNTHEEGDEAKISADGNPDGRQRVLDEPEWQVDDRDGQREDSDDPYGV